MTTTKAGTSWSDLLTPAPDCDVDAICAHYEPALRRAGLLEAVWADGPDAVLFVGRDTWRPVVPAVAA